MSSFRKSLEDDIQQELPLLRGVSLKKLLNRLLEVAESVEELPQLEDSDLQPPLKLLQARKLVKFFKHKYEQLGQPRGQGEPSSDDDNETETKGKTEMEMPNVLESAESMSVCSTSSVLPQENNPSHDSGEERLLDDHLDGSLYAAKEVFPDQTRHFSWQHPLPATSEGRRFPEGQVRQGHSRKTTLSSSKSSLEQEETHRSYSSDKGGRTSIHTDRPSNTPAFTKEQMVRMYGSRTGTRAGENAGTHFPKPSMSTDTAPSTIEESSLKYGGNAAVYGVEGDWRADVLCKKEELEKQIEEAQRKKADQEQTLTELQNELGSLTLDDRELDSNGQTLRQTLHTPSTHCTVPQDSDIADGPRSQDSCEVMTVDGNAVRQATEEQLCLQQTDESLILSSSSSASTESEVLQYRSLDEEGAACRMRVVLLGPEGAGKTSLVNTLLKKDFRNQNIMMTKAKCDSTGKIPHLAEIICDADIPVTQEKKVPKCFDEKPDLNEMCFWEFGSQSGSLNTFTTFIGHRSLYIVVLDMTKALNDTVSTQCGNEDDEEFLDISCPETVAELLDHFCTRIKTFVPSSDSDRQTYPILIICTHRDKCTDREVLQYQKRLYNYLISTPYRYQIHVEFFLMSNKIHDERKIGQIRETIISLGRDQSCKIPQSWMTFKGELVGCTPEHEPMRTWEEAKIAGQKVGIGENKLVEVLSALNDVGELFFIDDDRLRNFIVTDLRWLLQQLQRVTTPSRHRDWTLDDDICPDSRGLLHETSLHKVWSEDVRTHLCYLMERLRMLFSITATEKAGCSQNQKDKRYLVPCLLRSGANLNLQEGTVPPVVLTSSTRFLPVGLTASLIVAMIEEEKWTLTGGIYKDAATFLPKGYDSSIKLSISERNFKIYVGGKNLTGNDLCTDFRDGLKVVMNRLNRVLSTFNTEMSFSLGIYCPGAKEGDAPLELGECGDAYKKEMFCELHGHRCDVSGYSVWFCKDADQELGHSDKVTPKPMEILSELVDQMVQNGASEAMFVCECSSQGATAIWQKSGVQITSDDKYQIDVDGGKHTLVIRNVVHEDSGEYAIVFSCGNSLQARLQVEGIAATRTKLKEAVNVLLDELEDDEARLVGPTGIAARAADLSFLAQIKELRILLDGDVSNIETKGTPDAKARELIRHLLPCHTPQLVKFMWVMIQVQQSHQLPKSITRSVKTLLSRYNKTGIKQLADSMDHGGQVNEPPELLQKLDDQQVYTSSTAELTCRIREGDPEASVRWSRKGAGEISSSTKYEMTYADQVATLTIAAVTLSDDDDYTCKATNSVGSVETTCHLSVTKSDSQRKSSSSVLHRVPSSLNTDTTSLPLQQYSSPQGLQRTRYTSGGASNGVSEAQEACDHTTTRNNGGSHLLIARSAACGSLILYSHWYGLADVRNLLMMAKSFPCYTLDRVNQKLQMDLALTNLVFTFVTNCCH